MRKASILIFAAAIVPAIACAQVKEEWVARYNAPEGCLNTPQALAVDSSGNVYVTGNSGKSNNFFPDCATVKYDSQGLEQWSARYNGPGNALDAANAMALDASGSVYVTGLSENSDSTFDYVTIKYDSGGSELWTARYNGPRDGSDWATALTLDSSGNVYVTGYCDYLYRTHEEDYATVKYNSGGLEQWAARYDGPGAGWDKATALAVDTKGNVYVTGCSKGKDSGEDYATVKYNSGGIEQWVARYNGPGDDADRALGLALDASGDVYVTGSSMDSDTTCDYATVKYNPQGIQQWVARYNGKANLYGEAVAVAVDAPGNVYVTGRSINSGSTYDYCTVKYSQGKGIPK